ncbi:MAG TPA: polysaccharide biosynthesis tyrosine autokinase [Acidimicrobiales bacterium]|nr:polysaccharide biosynthesis tyrosine autokinase [Acidimicrobiales bacterium]
MSTEVLPELDLRRYLDGLVRRKLTVLAVVVLAVATALAVSFTQSPVYEGKADIVLHLSSASSLFPGGNVQTQLDPKLLIDTEIKMIESKPVRDGVTRQLGPHQKVSAARVDETLLIEVDGFGGSPKRAADIANAYARAYIDQRQQQGADELRVAGGALQAQIDDLQKQIDQIDAQVNAAPAADREALRSTLATRRDSLANQQSLFRQRLDELRVDSGLTSTEVQLVAPATPTKSPVKPTPVRNTLLAVAVGLIFGVGVASVMEYFDDSIRSTDDVTRLTGLPLLGAIPSFQAKHAKAKTAAASMHDQDPSVTEAYRSLRTSVQLLGMPRPLKTFQFTSAGPGEGKTTTVAQLALAVAATGRRVVVVDADLRRPTLNEVFDLANDVGLTSVVLGHLPVLEALQPVPGHDTMMILTTGSLPNNPSELLSLKRTSEVIFELESNFDMVLIDSAPVVPVTDSIVLSAWVEAVVMLAAIGTTKRRHLRRAVQLLNQAESPVVGSVVVRVPPETSYGYDYYRRHGTPGGEHDQPGRRRAPEPATGSPPRT